MRNATSLRSSWPSPMRQSACCRAWRPVRRDAVDVGGRRKQPRRSQGLLGAADERHRQRHRHGLEAPDGAIARGGRSRKCRSGDATLRAVEALGRFVNTSAGNSRFSGQPPRDGIAAPPVRRSIAGGRWPVVVGAGSIGGDGDGIVGGNTGPARKRPVCPCTRATRRLLLSC